jgi:hypothetical protein
VSNNEPTHQLVDGVLTPLSDADLAYFREAAANKPQTVFQTPRPPTEPEPKPEQQNVER